MTRPNEYEKDQSRPRDASDRAADISVDDAGTQQPDPPSGPEEGDDLKVVDKEDVGAGTGLDEAELGRVDPLDGKPWDGDPSDPLQPTPPADQDFPAEKRGPGEIEED